MYTTLYSIPKKQNRKFIELLKVETFVLHWNESLVNNNAISQHEHSLASHI